MTVSRYFQRFQAKLCTGELCAPTLGGWDQVCNFVLWYLEVEPWLGWRIQGTPRPLATALCRGRWGMVNYGCKCSSRGSKGMQVRSTLVEHQGHHGQMCSTGAAPGEHSDRRLSAKVLQWYGSGLWQKKKKKKLCQWPLAQVLWQSR